MEQGDGRGRKTGACIYIIRASWVARRGERDACVLASCASRGGGKGKEESRVLAVCQSGAAGLGNGGCADSMAMWHSPAATIDMYAAGRRGLIS